MAACHNSLLQPFLAQRYRDATGYRDRQTQITAGLTYRAELSVISPPCGAPSRVIVSVLACNKSTAGQPTSLHARCMQRSKEPSVRLGCRGLGSAEAPVPGLLDHRAPAGGAAGRCWLEGSPGSEPATPGLPCCLRCSTRPFCGAQQAWAVLLSSCPCSSEAAAGVRLGRCPSPAQ